METPPPYRGGLAAIGFERSGRICEIPSKRSWKPKRVSGVNKSDEGGTSGEFGIVIEIFGRENRNDGSCRRRFRLDLTVPEDESEDHAVRRVAESVEGTVREATRFYRGIETSRKTKIARSKAWSPGTLETLGIFIVVLGLIVWFSFTIFSHPGNLGVRRNLSQCFEEITPEGPPVLVC